MKSFTHWVFFISLRMQVLIESGADPWIQVHGKPIHKFWGKQKANGEKPGMSEKLKDYIEQLKPDEE